MGAIGQELREHPALRQLVAAVQHWRAVSGERREEALRRYYEAAATLIGHGITLYDLDPMDMLPDELMPLVWQEAYAETFTKAVAQEQEPTAAD